MCKIPTARDGPETLLLGRILAPFVLRYSENLCEMNLDFAHTNINSIIY